jgi:hypothetical protein
LRRKKKKLISAGIAIYNEKLKEREKLKKTMNLLKS